MIKNSLLALLSTFIRFAANGLLLILLAREWGANTFGQFMLPYIIANIIALIVDYGFNLQLVRDISRDPNKVGHLVREALHSKVAISILTILFSTAAISVVKNIESIDVSIFIVLTIAALLNSFGTFLNLSFRGLSRFELESASIVIGDSILVAIVSYVALLTHSGLLATAIAFLTARFIYLATSLIFFVNIINIPHILDIKPKRILNNIKQGLPFASQAAVGFLYFHADTLVIQYYIGASGVGVYQSGLGILLVCLKFSDVIASVYLVKLSKKNGNLQYLHQTAKSMLRHLLFIGLPIYSILLLCASIVVRTVYGSSNEYASLIRLMPFFSMTLILRYLLYAYATLLTVVSRQFVRTLAGLIALIVNLILNVIFVPILGVRGAAITTIATNLILSLVYIFATRRYTGSFLVESRSGILILLAILLAISNSVYDFSQATNIWIAVITCIVSPLIGFNKNEFRRLAQMFNNCMQKTSH